MNQRIHKVLIVDDVEDNQRIVEKILQSAGYITETAGDGLTALRLVKEMEFSLILLDIMMPIMDGIQTCRYLKAELHSASIPVIFLTANTERTLLLKAYSAGGSDYIRKPFFREELLARVEMKIKLREYEKDLEREVQERTKEMSETQIQLMHVLGGIAEGHSHETYKHVKRVTEFTYKLAKLYGMDEKEAKELKDASSLHDIGKLGIKDYILHKDDKLTKSEYEEMKDHAQLGVSMLGDSRLPLFEKAKIVAGEHHEKYDGSGYPRGLKGEDIHIYGRIVALADVFDALSFKRSYKKSWSTEEVLAYMKNMSGKHFDPHLVNLFFENLDDFLNIYNIQIEKHKLEEGLKTKKRSRVIEWFLRGR